MKNGAMSLSIGYLVTADRERADGVRELHGIDLWVRGAILVAGRKRACRLAPFTRRVRRSTDRLGGDQGRAWPRPPHELGVHHGCEAALVRPSPLAPPAAALSIASK
jgi:hypothetical protein